MRDCKSQAQMHLNQFFFSSFQENNQSTAAVGAAAPPHRLSCFLRLQDEHDRLLTKYAEAENTIDRLRLEAKVISADIQPHFIPSSCPGFIHSEEDLQLFQVFMQAAVIRSQNCFKAAAAAGLVLDVITCQSCFRVVSRTLRSAESCRTESEPNSFNDLS